MFWLYCALPAHKLWWLVNSASGILEMYCRPTEIGFSTYLLHNVWTAPPWLSVFCHPSQANIWPTLHPTSRFLLTLTCILHQFFLDGSKFQKVNCKKICAWLNKIYSVEFFWQKMWGGGWLKSLFRHIFVLLVSAACPVYVCVCVCVDSFS